MRGKINSADAELMAQLRAAGMTLREIGEKFEVSIETVRNHLRPAGAHRVPGPLTNRQNGMILRLEAAEGRALDEALRDYAARRYSLAFTAQLLGIAWPTLVKFAAHYGVEFETRRGRTAGYAQLCTRQASEAARIARLHTHGITYNGETLSAQAWSQRLGGGAGLVKERLTRGWSVEKAVTTPPMKRGVRRGPVRRRAAAATHIWRTYETQRIEQVRQRLGREAA